ncbi:MAG: MFS transporter [Acidobacteria bacterium]|nr:MFS transporter [Acidobacteriota bacterium]
MPSSGPNKATHIRWGILASVVAVTILTYLDRLNLGIAGKYIQDELSFSTHTMGWVLSAFLLGYSLFQVPGGWAGDRFGPKTVLTAAILLWSLFTALTGLAPGLPIRAWLGTAGSLMLIRFLVGVGEAAAAPNCNKLVANWIGAEQHGVGSSAFVMGIGIGGALTPPLIAWVMEKWGWRSSFYLAGVIGVAVAVFWHRYVTNSPEENYRVNSEELALIHRARKVKYERPPAQLTTPWRQILSNRSVWGVLLGYFCQGFPIYFFHTWFFIYLVRVRHLSIAQGGVWGATPYIAIAVLAPTGGWFSDRAVRNLGKRWGRRLAVCLGMFASSILMWTGAAASNSRVAVTLLALGAGLNMFSATSFWATCIDVTEQSTASLSGLMNTFGNFGGWLSPIVSAYVATRFGWNHALDCAAVVTMASAVFFLLVQADQKVDLLPVHTAALHSSPHATLPEPQTSPLPMRSAAKER